MPFSRVPTRLPRGSADVSSKISIAGSVFTLIRLFYFGFTKMCRQFLHSSVILRLHKKKKECFILYAVIDIGSNTIRLVFYTIENNRIVPALNTKSVAGLAAYCDRKGCLSETGIARAVEILSRFCEVTRHIAVDGLYPFATASLRNIQNTVEVLDVIRAKCGLSVRVLTGQEEALFDYYGAISTLDTESGLLIDIGGGSTELVFFREREAKIAESLPIGSLNLFSHFVSGILPTQTELDRIERAVFRYLETIELPNSPLTFQPICAVGGTARAAQKLHNLLNNLPNGNAQYEYRDLKKIVSLLRHNPAKLTTLILQIAPERIHTLIPGLLLLQSIAKYYQSDTIITSPYGVREGFLHAVLAENGVLPPPSAQQ